MEVPSPRWRKLRKYGFRLRLKLELYKEQYKADKEAYDILSPQMEKRGKIIEKHTKLETLYKLLSGNMSGNRMDLKPMCRDITWRRLCGQSPLCEYVCRTV